MTQEPASQGSLLERRAQLTGSFDDSPYDLIPYLERAAVHAQLSYPDLAAGDAYRALLLSDEVLNEGFEYHEEAVEALQAHAGAAELPRILAHGKLADDEIVVAQGDSEEEDPVVRRLATLASVRAYQILAQNLLFCGCLKSAASFCLRGLEVSPQNEELLAIKADIDTVASRRLRRGNVDIATEVSDLPERGLVRREVYPWNEHEPDRFAPESLAELNAQLAQMAPKCAVQVATLPVLREGVDDTGNDLGAAVSTCRQLGVFAHDDIAPGEAVLQEYSLLTANNRLKDALCDACGSDLPPLGSDTEAVSCADCYDTVFCTQFCHDQAQERYHPAVCDLDVDAIAKDPDAFEADDTLYLLLLARVMAMAAHEDTHPLDVREVKYIWGDFIPVDTNAVAPVGVSDPPAVWSLPFSFKYNIETPLHVLEKMDINIFTALPTYDLWVLNTLYSKFRGTASARKSLRDGRPDVAAVHPYWCLANHDCDPNVTWEWGGRMVLTARQQRVVGGGPGGIRRGDEILNHYCDISLPVHERREWAEGSLGGWCMCQRCRDEAAAAAAAAPAKDQTV